MHKSTVLGITIGVVALLIGCAPKSDVERLEKSLGDFRYLGLTPQIKVRILKREIVKPTSEYGRPSLKVTGVVQQEADFPVANYVTQVTLIVKSGDNKIGTAYLNATIEGRTAAFTEEIYLPEWKGAAPDPDSLTIEITDFGWFPKRDDKGKVVLDIAR